MDGCLDTVFFASEKGRQMAEVRFSAQMRRADMVVRGFRK